MFNQINFQPGKPFSLNDYDQALLIIARHRLTREDAADAVQETKIRFLIALQENRIITNEKSFLIGILRNVINEILRQNRRTVPQDDDPPVIERIEQTLIEEEQTRLVRQSLAEMTPEEQELLKLQIIEEKSFATLERMLGVPHANLHRKFKKCLTKFARILKKNGINPFILTLL